MKHQRSSTFSSPCDSYQYSQDSVQMNGISLSNQQKIDYTPIDKLRGQPLSGFQPHADLKSIISPFQENQVGLPISYLDINGEHNTSTPSAGNSLKKQSVYISSDIMQLNDTQQEELIKQNKNEQKQGNQMQVINNDHILLLSTKVNDISSSMENNSGVNTGTFGGKRTTSGIQNKSAGQDTFGQYQNSLYMNSNPQFNESSQKQKLNNGYESPFLKNVSTECKTNSPFNENLSGMYNKQPDYNLTHFSPSPLQQTKQQQVINQNTQQYDFKISPCALHSLQQQKDDLNNRFTNKDSNNNSLYITQNENTGKTKSQNQDPNNPTDNISNILIGIANLNQKNANVNNGLNQNQILNQQSIKMTQQPTFQNQNINQQTPHLNQYNQSTIQPNPQFDKTSQLLYVQNSNISLQNQQIYQNQQINSQNLNQNQINNSNNNLNGNNTNNQFGNNASFGLQNNNNNLTQFQHYTFYNAAQNSSNQQQTQNNVGNNGTSPPKTYQQGLVQRFFSFDEKSLKENSDDKKKMNYSPNNVDQSKSQFSKNNKPPSKNNLTLVINNEQYPPYKVNNKQNNYGNKYQPPQSSMNEFYDQMFIPDNNQSAQSQAQKNKKKSQLPASSMNEFYDQMFMADNASENQSPNKNQQQSNNQFNQSICIESDDEDQQDETIKRAAGINLKQQSIIQDEQSKKQNQDIEILKKIIKESQEFIKDLEDNIQRQEKEKGQLQEFARNMENRNNLQNERIQLLEQNLQNLNTQNIENIDKIVKLNEKIQQQEKIINQKNLQNISSTNEVNQFTKDLQEKVQKFEKNQQEIQMLIQKDLNQEKKILELMSDITRMQSLRSDYEKSIAEQEILTQNNNTYLQTIEQKQQQIINLQNLLSSKSQDSNQTYLLIEKAYQEKQVANIEIQNLKDKNKSLEENIQTLKTSCQKLEAAMTANCNSTKEWLGKYNALEKNYINLQNQQRSQQNSDSNQSSKRDIQIRSQSSLHRFRSDISESELKVQQTKNKELIFSEINDERNQTNQQNENLKQQIKELSTKNQQQLLQIQELQSSLSKQNEESEKQKKDLVQIINLMISENNKLVEANSERPQLLQKIQDLTQQIERLKTSSSSHAQKPFETFNNLESSGISIAQPPPQFNSPQEEVKWYKQRCGQLEVKLGIKSEEYAELVYQVKLMKKQVRQSPQNNDDNSIKSSLYQVLNQSQLLQKSPQKHQDEIVLNNYNQNAISEQDSQQGCCKRSKKEDEILETNESSACNIKCL